MTKKSYHEVSKRFKLDEDGEDPELYKAEITGYQLKLGYSRCRDMRAYLMQAIGTAKYMRTPIFLEAFNKYGYAETVCTVHPHASDKRQPPDLSIFKKQHREELSRLLSDPAIAPYVSEDEE